MKKEIKPHKGGRDQQLTIRLTPAEKAEITEIAERHRMNRTDLIVEAVRKFDKAC